MSDESRKDDVLDLTNGMAPAPSEADGAAAAGEESAHDAGGEEVLELGEHHIVEGEDHVADPHVETKSSIPAPPKPSEPPERKPLDQIPMARISYYPSSSHPPAEPVPVLEAAPEPEQSAAAAQDVPVAHEDDEAFELHDGHVVEAEAVQPSDQGPVDHAFDFGTPAMVFDDAEPSNATKPLVATESTTLRDDNTQEQVDFHPGAESLGNDTQPAHAVPFNQPPEVAEEPSSQEYVSFIDDVVPPPGAVAVEEPEVPKRPSSVDDVFGDAAKTSSEPLEPQPVFAQTAEEAKLTTSDVAGSVVAEAGPPADATPIPEESSGTPSPNVAAQTTAAAEAFFDEPSEHPSEVEMDIDISEVEVEEVEAEAEAPRETAKPPPPPEFGSGRPLNSFFKNDKIDAANASLKLQAKTARRSRGKKREWWASIFDDEYLMLLPERTAYEQQKQIDFIQRYLGLPPGALLLDLACGNGRNSIGMAQRNYRIVGVDLSLSMLARAGDAAQDAGQKINFIHGDMRDLGFDKTFDGVFSLDTSFGYFDEPTNMKVLQGVYRALKPGGTFLLELANRDFVIKQQPNMVWFQMDNMVCMEETDFNYINNRLYISRQLIIGDNEKQSKHEFSLRLYSLHEIGQLLHQAGFAVVKVSGHRATPGAFFGPESAKLIIIAERRGE